MRTEQKKSMIITSILTSFTLLILTIILLPNMFTKNVNANILEKQDTIINDEVLVNEENELRKGTAQQLKDLYNNGQTDMTNKVDVEVNFYDLPESIREALEEDYAKSGDIIDYDIPFILSDFQ